MHPGIKILYTSGYTQNAIVHNGRLDDDAFLLSKPYRKDELARKLRSVFAGTARGPLQAEPPAVAPPAERRGKILVVEDVMLIRMATVDMVEQIGFQAHGSGRWRRSAGDPAKGSGDRNPAHRSGPAGHEWPPIGGRGAPPQARPQGDHRVRLFHGESPPAANPMAISRI